MKPLADVLTPLQLERARLVAEGFSNRVIAARTGVSEISVRQALNNIYIKLGFDRDSTESLYLPRILLALRYDREYR